jgi:uncharacterized RDD family membrane protein YckC
MESADKGRFFDPHGTARAQALAGVELATFRQRMGAFFLDFFIVFVTYAPFDLLRQYLILSYRHEPLNIRVAFDFHDPFCLLWLVLYYGLIVWKTNGQTPGKRLQRIRIVSLVHERITLWQSVERALGYGASVLEGGFGFIQYFIHPNHACVHDRIAETVVIKEPKPARKPEPIEEQEAVEEPEPAEELIPRPEPEFPEPALE